jgi:FlaA1/EpsC-like NDP-sugar epimerase
LEFANPGEVYIPMLPAARIGDMAKVMSNGNPVKVIGKGPGEKMDETLITEDEAERVVIRGEYYVVTATRQTKPAISREYVSRDHLINPKEIENLFIRHRLISGVVVA